MSGSNDDLVSIIIDVIGADKAGADLSVLRSEIDRLPASGSGAGSAVKDLEGHIGNVGTKGEQSGTMLGKFSQVLKDLGSTAGGPIEKIASSLGNVTSRLGSAQKLMDNFGKSGKTAGEETEAAAVKAALASELAGEQGEKAGDKTLAGALQAVVGYEAETAAATEAAAAETEASFGLNIVIGGLIATFGALAVVTAKGAEDYMNLAEKTQMLENATGASAVQASTMLAIMDHFGVSSDRTAQILTRFSSTLDTNQKKFESLGITIARNSDGSVDAARTLSNVNEAYQKAGDATQKAAIANAVYAKNAASMSEVLKATPGQLQAITDKANNMGLIINQGQVDSALAMQHNMNDLKDSLRGMGMTLAEDVVPMLTRLVGGLTQVVTWATEGYHAISSFDDSINKVNDSTHGLLGILMPTVAMTAKLFSTISSGTNDTNKGAQALQDMAAGQAQLLQETETLTNAMNGANSAQSSYSQGLLDIKSAAYDVQDAQSALTKLQQTQGIDASEVANDNDQLSSAYTQQANSLTSLHDAQNAYNQVISTGTQIINSYKDASETANADAQQAAYNLYQAQSALQTNRDPAKEAQLEIALNNAKADSATKTNDAAKAASTWAEVQKGGLQATSEYQSAVKSLDQAQQSLSSSSETIAKDQITLAQAMQKPADLAEQIGKAQIALATAQQSYNDKLQGLPGLYLAAQSAGINYQNAMANTDPYAASQFKYNVKNATQQVSGALGAEGVSSGPLMDKWNGVLDRMQMYFDSGAGHKGATVQAINFAGDPKSIQSVQGALEPVQKAAVQTGGHLTDLGGKAHGGGMSLLDFGKKVVSGGFDIKNFVVGLGDHFLGLGGQSTATKKSTEHLGGAMDATKRKHDEYAKSIKTLRDRTDELGRSMQAAGMRVDNAVLHIHTNDVNIEDAFNQLKTYMNQQQRVNPGGNLARAF